MKMVLLSEVLEMPSRDAEGYGGHKVKDLLDLKRSDEFYPELLESVRRKYIYRPVMIVDGVLRNGHHRVAAAVDAGLTEIPYTEDDDTDWSDEWPNDQVPASWCWDEEDSASG